MYGRKKRPGGRGGINKGGSDSGSGSDSAGGGGGSGSGSEDSRRRASSSRSRPRNAVPPSISSGGGGGSSSSSSVGSLLSKSDKYGVLRTIEGLPERELVGPTLVTAWDRLAQRTASAGPRAPHLPPLHLDRAFHLLVERTWRRLPDLAPGHCASVASSLAKLRYRPEDAFLSDLLRSCQAQAEAQSFGTAARLAASLARLDYDFGGGGGPGQGHGKGELGALAATMRERLMGADLETLDPESVAMGLWALAVLGALQGQEQGSDDLRERLLAAAISRLQAAHAAAAGTGAGVGGDGELASSSTSSSSLLLMSGGRAKNLVRICRQLRMALLFLPSPPKQETAAEAQAPAPALALAAPPAQAELAGVIERVWRDLGEWLDPVRRSRLQEEVERTLRAGGGRPAGEWGDGVVTVDIALHPRAEAASDVDEMATTVAAAAAAAAASSPSSSSSSSILRPVALEVDGPSHFFLNQPQRPTGDTKIKHQALHVGYPQQWAAVISVPHFEWPRLEKHRLDLLHRKLRQAGLEPAHFLAERKGNGSGNGSGSGHGNGRRKGGANK